MKIKIVVLLVIICLSTSRTKAQFTIVNTFMGSSAGSDIALGGNPSAYLTSGIDDPVNAGWLRLTKAVTNQRGYAYITTPFPSTLGVYADFEYKAWRSSNTQYYGADGFCIYFFDASATFALGGYGGSLGYAPNTNPYTGNVTTGLAGGYLGIGIDAFGEYSDGTEGRNGGVGKKCHSVSIRGYTTNNPTTTNYYLTGVQLQTNSTADGPTAVNYNTLTTIRPTDDLFYRRVKVYIVPSGSNYVITVKWRTSPTGSDITLLTYTTATPPPANLKIGFGATTGGGYDYHEIRNLLVTTPGNVRVEKMVDKVNANVGDPLTYTVNVVNETPVPLNGLLLNDTLRDGKGNNIVLGSDFTINSVTFNNNGNSSNTAAAAISNVAYTSGTAVTSGFTTNPLNFSLNLAPNSTSTFTIVGTVNRIPSGGTLSNTAFIDPTPTGITDEDLTNNTAVVSTSILVVPDVDFTVAEAVNNPCADTVNGNTFTITVSNLGATSSPNNTQVTVTDVIPSGLTVLSAGGTGWTTTSSGNTYTFTRNDALASMHSYPPITVQVKAPSVTGTSWTNTATVAYASTETNTNNNSGSAILYASPTVVITNPAAACKPNTVNLTASSITAGSSSNLSYAYYSNAAGTATISTPSAVATSGTYYIKGTSTMGCVSALMPVTVKVNVCSIISNGFLQPKLK